MADRVLIAEHQLYPRILSHYAARPFDAGWIEAQVDALAQQLPEVGRKTSHGSPGWSVGGEKGKLFAIIADHHHGEEAIGLLVKASGPDEMTGLIEAQPDIYYWPKYYGASGWLGVKLNRRDVDWDQVREWLERSWRACAPPRLTKLMRAAEEFMVDGSMTEDKTRRRWITLGEVIGISALIVSALGLCITLEQQPGRQADPDRRAEAGDPARAPGLGRARWPGARHRRRLNQVMRFSR